MGVLVEDPLTLARLDEIAEAPQPRSTCRLADDAVGDAAAVAPDRAIGLGAAGRDRARRRAPAAPGAGQSDS